MPDSLPEYNWANELSHFASAMKLPLIDNSTAGNKQGVRGGHRSPSYNVSLR